MQITSFRQTRIDFDQSRGNFREIHVHQMKNPANEPDFSVMQR
jgi:hypothetical protein